MPPPGLALRRRSRLTSNVRPHDATQGNMRRQVTEAELDRLYRGIGRGVWLLQYVEDALCSLIALKHEIRKPGGLSEEDAWNALSKHRQNTLGTSLKLIRQHNLLPEPLLRELQSFKDERDWLVHRSQNSHGDLLYTEDGRALTFERLESFAIEARRLQDQVLHEIADFLRSHSVDVEKADLLANRAIKRLKGEA
jgi:hypothetical protein